MASEYHAVDKGVKAIESDGTIVAVSPTAEEVRAYLTEFFK